MNRLALAVEYRGSAFAGWQTQAALRTVQGELEAALARVADERIELVGAGRTDAGVHAREQIAHFDTRAERSLRAWTLGTNTNLPADVSVSWTSFVPAHFHARYSAEARTYRYLIFNRAVRSSLVSKRAAFMHRPLDERAMSEAATFLVGEHDFSAFRAAECQAKSPVRRLFALNVRRFGHWVIIEASANAFLHHMMRNIAGLLMAVGRAEQSPVWAGEVLAGRDRTRNAATAPAEGLYLWRVRYPAAFRLPQSSIIPAFDIEGV